jgi:hypothetical protein
VAILALTGCAVPITTFEPGAIVIGPPIIRDLPSAELTRRPLLRRTLCGQVLDDQMVGNLGNLLASQGLLTQQIFEDFWAQAWEFPPVLRPGGMRCSEWVCMNPNYFGHGAAHW